MDGLRRKSTLSLMCCLCAGVISAAPAGAAQVPDTADDAQDRGVVFPPADDRTLQESIPAEHPDGLEGSGDIPGSLVILAAVGGICGATCGRWFGQRIGLWVATGVLLGVGIWGIAGTVSIILSHPSYMASG